MHPYPCLIPKSVRVFAAACLLPAMACSAVHAAETEKEPYAAVSAIIRPHGTGRAAGRNLLTEEEHTGDIMEVAQQLVDALTTDNGGSGGKILVRNGKYITTTGWNAKTTSWDLVVEWKTAPAKDVALQFIFE